LRTPAADAGGGEAAALDDVEEPLTRLPPLSFVLSREMPDR
jgi:hypothetical protein